MKGKFYDLLAVLIVLILGIILQYRYMNEFPMYTHAWAQSDHYAIALGYTDNGLNIRKPQTYVLNRQFPDDWQTPTDSRRTSVNLPVHHFIVAVLMKATGSRSPWVFRLYTFLYSIIGLFFLYKLADLITRDHLKALFLVIFASTAPVFVYYQASFLPTIPALSNAIIGLYLYLRYSQRQSRFGLWLSLGFLCLATLCRTTFAIPLIAICGVEGLRVITGKTKFRLFGQLLPALLAVSAILAYTWYDGVIREKYGSLFLNELLYPSSLPEMIRLYGYSLLKWGLSYFSPVHYLLLCIIGIIALLSGRKDTKNNWEARWLFMAVLCGALIFSVLMLHQFPDHDYYFLDTFFLPLIIGIGLLMSKIRLQAGGYSRFTIPALVVLFIIPLAMSAARLQQARRTPNEWDRTQAVVKNFNGTDKFLDSLQVNKNARILVLDAIAPNIPFIKMNRPGFVVISTKEENLKRAMEWDFDYVVYQTDYFLSDIYPNYPQIKERLEKVGENGRITVCKKTAPPGKSSLFSLVGFDRYTPVLTDTITFEQPADSMWKHAQSTFEYQRTGHKSGYVNPVMEFGVSYHLRDSMLFNEAERTLTFSGHFLSREEIKPSKLVISVTSKGQNKFYATYPIHDQLSHPKSWEKVEFLINIPKLRATDEFSLYLWNVSRSDIFYDDISFAVY